MFMRILRSRFSAVALSAILPIGMTAITATSLSADSGNETGPRAFSVAALTDVSGGTAGDNLVDPVLSAALGRNIYIPNTLAALDGEALLHDSNLDRRPLKGALSMSGFVIERINDPLIDLELALFSLVREAAATGDARFTDTNTAQELVDILTGATHGRVYDGFALLNYNRGSFAAGHIDGEYKMKRLVDSGEYVVSAIDGERHRIWDLTVNMLWTGQNFDSDTFLVRIPAEADRYDELRVNWRIYSLIHEDLAPTTIVNDGFGRIMAGLDSTFETLPQGQLSTLSVRYPSLTHFRGMYIWGWGVHPPRVQFLQPVWETADGNLNPAGLSFATRTREDMTIDAIGAVAPEMKIYQVALQALSGDRTGAEIHAMLTTPSAGPEGTFSEWLALAKDLRQLPPEAWDVLAREDGLAPGETGSYDIILAYLNNEIYGTTPFANSFTEGSAGVMRDWEQGGTVRVKIINLDNITHYYRNVDFGAAQSNEMEEAFGNGQFSFERFNPKPTFGVPKVAEMQWRTGWGFVPHLGIATQPGVFPRSRDQALLEAFTGQLGQAHLGYLYRNVSGYWRFNPPAAIRVGNTLPAGDPLRDGAGSDGVRIGLDTPGFGIARMPEGPITTHPNRAQFAEVRFPGFLRNPGAGGDIIPPTPVWAPFLTLNPETGTLQAPDGSWWVDQTYFHGMPVPPGGSIIAEIEAPRASAQLFYQFDPLFHDNMIFSLHPRSDAAR